MVPKLDTGGRHTGWRIVCDYMQVNEMTVRDQYPLPIVQDVIDRLQGKRVIRVLDVLSGYWCIPMVPEHRERTAMCTPAGHWQMKVMPMGLKNSGPQFQRQIGFALRDLPFACAYVDDVCVFWVY